MKYKLGLIAKDIQNSVSPKVYKSFAESMDMEVTYDIYNIPEERLEETLEYARLNLNGFNVTMPYKQSVLQYMDTLDESARQCGSANTVLVKDRKLIAYNTDGWGMVRLLRQKNIPVKEKHVVMLGAGGVAYSIAYHLKINGVKRVDVINLFPEQAQALCEKFGKKFTPFPLAEENLSACCTGADLFINASVMGQIGYDDFTDLTFLQMLNKTGAVFDVNYSNPDSKLVLEAIRLDLSAYRGKGMTACQGIRAMEIWTGEAPDDRIAADVVQTLESEGM